MEERNGRRADRTLVELDARVQLVQGAAEVASGQLDALGRAGGAGGVQDERGLVGCRHLTRVMSGRVVPPGQVVEVGDQAVAVEAEGADVGDQGGGRRVGDDHARIGSTSRADRRLLTAVKIARHLAAPYMTSANSGPLAPMYATRSPGRTSL